MVVVQTLPRVTLTMSPWEAMVEGEGKTVSLSSEMDEGEHFFLKVSNFFPKKISHRQLECGYQWLAAPQKLLDQSQLTIYTECHHPSPAISGTSTWHTSSIFKQNIHVLRPHTCTYMGSMAATWHKHPTLP